MELYEINPHIRYARIHKTTFSTRNEISICYDCRIFFFRKTTGYVSVNGEKLSIADGTVLFFPPLQEYKFSIIPNEQTEIIILDFDLTSEFAHIKSSLGTASKKSFDPTLSPAYELPSEFNAVIINQTSDLYSLLYQCAENFIIKNDLYRERSSALLKLFLLNLISKKNHQSSPQCKKIIELVHQYYSEPQLTNKDIAKALNYHPNHINRIIKKETGKSLRSYITYYRLQIAKNLLLTTNQSISEISYSTGFCSPAYFIKTFKESTGSTPTKYRAHRMHTEI
jgi:AraC-like DNA-binding protein